MSLPQSQLLWTPEEYLTREREAFERHEWLDGLIYAMSGESPQHSLICSNVNAILNLQLRGKPCAVYSPNMKVYSRLPGEAGLKGLFSYLTRPSWAARRSFTINTRTCSQIRAHKSASRNRGPLADDGTI